MSNGMWRWLLLLCVLLAAACGGDDDPAQTTSTAPAQGDTRPSPTPIGGSMILATTTSTQDSGLLDVLVPMFREQTGVEVKVIAVGTGAALEMAGRGEADAVLAHALSSEQQYIERGDLVNQRLIMHNDFVIVGPPSDPAKVSGTTDLKAVMAAIARTGPFISRGDRSGTHTMELNLWKAAGVDPASVARREETGQGMGATLNIADQKGAYTLTDRGTFLANRKNLRLAVLFEGDASLLNIYHAYVVNPQKWPAVKRAQAEAFVEFLVAPGTQKVIAEFGKDRYGEPLFVADAGKKLEELGKR